jgi:hypothetical protein
MPPTYADLASLIDAATQSDRAPSMPLLGPLCGLALALLLWCVIGWLCWALVA